VIQTPSYGCVALARHRHIILEIDDVLQHVIDTDEPYRPLLDPPALADEHGNLLPLPEWKPGHPKPPNWPRHPSTQGGL